MSLSTNQFSKNRTFEEDYFFYLQQKKFREIVRRLYLEKFTDQGISIYYNFLNTLGAFYLDQVNSLNTDSHLEKIKTRLTQTFPDFDLNVESFFNFEERDNKIFSEDQIVSVFYSKRRKIVNLIWRDFEFELSQKIYDRLFNKIQDDFENPNFEILRMCLRYQNIGCDSSFFFSLIPHFWPFLENWVRQNTKYEPIECFASPLNNNFPVFHSLFLDVDEKFGSLGDFLNPENHSLSSGFYIINPPYTDSILQITSKKVIDSLEKIPNFSAILSWPHWLLENETTRKDSRRCVTHNSEHLLNLVNLPPNLLRWKRVLKAGEHLVVDIMKGKNYPSKVEEILLFVSNDPNLSLSLSEIENYLD